MATVELIQQALRQEISRRFQNNELEIPIMPHVATQALTLVHSPNVSIRDLAHLVEQDQVISARLIRIANSPLYRGLQEITNLQRAIVTIGLRSVSDLIFSLAMESKIFRSKHFQKRMTRLWEHSVGCAHIAQQLAKTLGRESDNAFLFGLLHDIGKTLIIDTIAAFIKKKPALAPLVTDESLEDLLREFHGPVGGLMARQWKFPDTLAATIVFHHDPPDNEKARPAVLLTAVANLLCHQYGIGVPLETTDLRNNPWVKELGLTAQHLDRFDQELPASTVLFMTSFQMH